MTDELLVPLHPNESALTPLFQAKIDEGMLREIAEADYGWKADKCYALLEPILGIYILDARNVESIRICRPQSTGDYGQFGLVKFQPERHIVAVRESILCFALHVYVALAVSSELQFETRLHRRKLSGSDQIAIQFLDLCCEPA
jgi:hypothetical protein